MNRIVAPEVLDGLASDDPAALRSRRDLRRVHRAMGTRSVVVRALKDMTSSWQKMPPRRVLELGAGDGSHRLLRCRQHRHHAPDLGVLRQHRHELRVDDVQLVDALQDADAALYAAKRDGRNTVRAFGLLKAA